MSAPVYPQLQYALVGCGLVGRKRAAALPAGTLRYACDPHLERADALASAHPGCRAHIDPADAFADPAVDAVIVATVNAALAPLALAAIRAGKHVLLEKPGAVTSAALRDLETAAATAGVCVRLGYNHRFHPALQQARRLVDDGALGPLLFLRARYGHGGRTGYDREWRADPALAGGGELIDQGVHLIDLAAWFLGDFATVEGHVTTSFWAMPVEDNAFVSLRTAAGQTAWLHASCTEWKNLFSFELYGRDGKVAVDGLGGSYGPERCTFHRMRPEMGPPDTTVWDYPGEDRSWADELAAFAGDVRLGRPPAPGLREGRRILEIVETLYQKSGYPLSAAPRGASRP